MLYEKIKVLAKKRGVSINQIEKDLEFSSSYLSKWNDSMPSADKLVKVATYLDTTVEELLSDPNKELDLVKH